MSVEVGSGPAREMSPAAPGGEERPSAGPQAGHPADLREQQPVIAHSAEDRQAIADLYASYIGCLFDYCHGLLQDPVLAADVVQDTLIAARENIAEPRGQEWLRTWMYAVARRLCQRELPDRQLAGPDGYPAGPTEDGDPDTTDFELADLDAFTRRRDAHVMIGTAVDRLPAADREVLSLHYRHEITGADLASVLDLPPEQAKDLVTSAGKRFAVAAATVIVRHARRGWVSCPGLVAMAQAEDPPPPPLAPQFRRQLARHLNSCPGCAEFRGERGFGPAMVTAIAPELPTPGLWDRIVAGVFDASAGPEPESAEPAWPEWLTPAPPRPARPRSRALWPLAAAAILVVVLGGGGVTYELTAGMPGHPQRAKVAAADQPAADARPAPAVGSAGPITGAAGHKTPQHTPSLFPPPIGVLPTPLPPSPAPSGSTKPPRQSPHPKPTHRKSSHSPKPPSGSPTPTPSGSGSPSPTPTPTPSSGNSPTPTPPPTSPAP